MKNRFILLLRERMLGGAAQCAFTLQHVMASHALVVSILLLSNYAAHTSDLGGEVLAHE